MKLIQFDLAYDGPFGQKMVEALAKSVPDEPPFVWKIWTENQTERGSGVSGTCLISDEPPATDDIVKHTARLKELGIESVGVELADVNGR